MLRRDIMCATNHSEKDGFLFMKNEYVISDFSSAVMEKDRVSTNSLPEKWETVPYETAEISGSLLIASENSQPMPVTVDPALMGWYKIYACMTDVFGGNHIDLRLTDDEFPTTAVPGKLGRYIMWIASEKAEESLWKCADMTGQKVEISKVRNGIPHTANLLWLRFVPMSAEEVEKHLAVKNDPSRKTMFAHMDGDFHANDGAKEPRDYCKALYAMKDSDVGIVTMEVINDLVDYDAHGLDYAPRAVSTRRRAEYMRELSEHRGEVYPVQIAYAHEHGMKMFAGHRMQLSCFAFPLEQPIFAVPFINAHPECRCIARDGRAIDFLSYGYETVHNFMIENIMESARYGFDGVHLIFDRGQHLLFEEPVKERFEKKYGVDKDFYRLPLSDARLIDVKSEILTEFLQKLRRALTDYAEKNGTKPLQIYITTYFSNEDALLDGFDMERFAKAGVIDGFVQAKMCVWEEVDDVMADDGKIDLDKYVEKANTEYVIRRDHSSNMERMIAGIAKYREIAEKYGISFYTENQWEGGQPAEMYARIAKKLYAAGAMSLALWDCYPVRVQNFGEWSATARLGKQEDVFSMPDDAGAYHRIIKILSYNGRDMRYYNPSWRG